MVAYAGECAYAGDCVYAEGAVVYALVAPVEFEVIEFELFLLPGDSEPRGSINRLISTIGEVDRPKVSP